MRRLVLLLALPIALIAAGCGADDSSPPAGIVEKTAAPVAAPPPTTASAPPSETTAAPALGPGAEAGLEVEQEEPRRQTLIARRRYEDLLNGRRAATREVVWSYTQYEGQRAIKDVTRVRSRSARMMGGVRDVFENNSVTAVLRTEDGDLLSMETVGHQGSQSSRVSIRRTPTGYSVNIQVEGNRESFEFETPGPAKLDAESFLGPKVRSGEAKPGATFTFPQLDTRRRRLVCTTVKVVGPDEEGPGLKVVETVEGSSTALWFAGDGSIVRLRAGTLVIRRRDGIDLDDLPSNPAAYRVTLPANVHLPRIFTARSMTVDILVNVDETVRPPQIPQNPFTEVIALGEDRVRVKLTSHDDPEADAELPMKLGGFEEHLKATPLMEVDSPRIRMLAREIVAGEKSARKAARRIGDYVFQLLSKGSPDTANPTALQILDLEGGDCSEHALLFTTLCRAAGIPARRCSGFVCIGDDWGGHAWTEIFVGKWIGADPTTNEIGTRARYIFCGRQDDREMKNTSIQADLTRIMIRKAEFMDGTLDFEKGELDSSVLSGIRLARLPEGWTVTRNGGMAWIEGPRVQAQARIQPDHGYRTARTLRRRGFRGFDRTTFGGRTAFRKRSSRNTYVLVPLGRQNLTVVLRRAAGATKALEQLARFLKPTLERIE